MDCTVHGVTKSQTWLNDFNFSHYAHIIMYISDRFVVIVKCIKVWGKESQVRRSPPSFQKAVCKSCFPTLACEVWTVLEPCSTKRSLGFEVRLGFEYWCYHLQAVWPWASYMTSLSLTALISDTVYWIPLGDEQEPVGEKSSFFFLNTS